MGSAGVLIQDVELKLVPVEGGEEGEGEIVVRGPNVMKGYYNNPTATAEVLSDDGWFHTGDIGRLDASGNLFITDRKKELFKLSTGKYVAPAPIENELVLSPFVEQCVVVGNTHKFCGALVVPSADSVMAELSKRGVKVSKEELTSLPETMKLLMEEVDRINVGLPHWEQVKKIALLANPFTIEGGELTPKMSMKRRVIQEKYKAEIESMYGSDVSGSSGKS